MTATRSLLLHSLNLGLGWGEWVTGLAEDATGNVLLLGFSLDPAGSGGGRPFLAQVQPQGSIQWVRTYTDAILGSDQQVFGLATGPSGAIYVTGFEQGTTPGTTRPGLYDGVLTSHTSDGSQIWRQWVGSSRLEQLAGVATTPTGVILTAGWSDGSVSGPSAGGMDLLINAFTSEGQTLWARQLGGSGNDRPTAIGATNDGGFVVVGHTSGPFAGLTHAGLEDAFILRFNAQGEQLWSRSIATAGTDHAYGVLALTDGDIVVTGRMAGKDWTTSGGDTADAFLARYAPNGDRRWLRRFGSDQYEYGRSLSLVLNGDILVSGRTQGDLLGLANQGGFDGFLARFSGEGLHQGSQLYGTSDNDAINQVLSLSNGTVLIAGMSSGALSGLSNERPGTYDIFIENIQLLSQGPWLPRLTQPRSDGILLHPNGNQPGSFRILTGTGGSGFTIQEGAFSGNEGLQITGLNPNTRYGYTLTDDNGTTQNGSFRTLPTAEEPTPFRFLALPANASNLTPRLLDLIDQIDPRILLSTATTTFQQSGIAPSLERYAFAGSAQEDTAQDVGIFRLRTLSEADIATAVPGSTRWGATLAWITDPEAAERISILLVPASAPDDYDSLMQTHGLSAVVRAPSDGMLDLCLRRFADIGANDHIARLDITPISSTGLRSQTNYVLINSQGIGSLANPAALDNQAPAPPLLRLSQDSGTSNTDGITNNSEVLIAGIEAGARWQWSSDGGHRWQNGIGSSFSLHTAGKHRLFARQIDTSGLLSPQSLELNLTLVLTGPTQTAIITDITDNLSLYTGSIPDGGISNDSTPTLSGTLSAALATGDTLRIFNGTTLLGNATINNTALTWTFTPTLPASPGNTYLFSAAISDAAGNLGTASTVRTLILDNTPSTTTAAISNVSDNSGTITGSVGAGKRSDDLTPTLSGTLSAPLLAGENLLIFNGTTLLGTASVNNTTLTWTYTPTLPPSPGTTYSFIARVADSAGNLGPASPSRSFILDTVAPLATATITDITDNLSLYTGSIPDGGISNDSTPTLSGTLSAALATGDTLRIFNGTTLLGNATVNNTARTWTFTPTLPASPGNTYLFSAAISDAAGNLGTLSTVRSLILDNTPSTTTAAISNVSDNSGTITGSVGAGKRSDDLTPTLSGTLSAPLLAGENLLIFNGTTLLGTASVNNTALTWTYTPTLLPSPGTTYSFIARVADPAGNLGPASPTRSFILDTVAPTQIVTITSISDNTGNIQGAITNGSISNDTTPTLSGSLSATLAAGEAVIVFRNGVAIGNAVVNSTTLTWSYTSPALISNGLHHFSAAVCDTAGNPGPISAPYSINLDASNFDTNAFTYNWNNATPLNNIQGLLKASVQVTNPRAGEKNFNATALRVDLQAPGISLISTDRIANWQANSHETLTQTTREFITSNRVAGTAVVAAVNTSFFAMDSTSQAPYATNLLGLSINNSTLVSPGESNYPYFAIDSITGARLERDQTFTPDLSRTSLALAGMANGITLWDGVVSGTSEQNTDLNARTALGLSSDNRYLVLLSVDRTLRTLSPSYWGASLYDVGVMLSGFGATRGLNLDGGGSTQMASWNPLSGSAELLNNPLFGSERLVGSNLGIVYQAPI